MSERFDYAVVGAGMGGLTVASLLAHAGARVCVLEAHDRPGGCAHSFSMGDYTFCAAVHYVFWCGEGEPIYNLLRKLGLHEEVRFRRLDPEGYDRFSCPSEGLFFRIPNGLDKLEDRLIDRFPAERRGIRRFFGRVGALVRDLRSTPFEIRGADLLWAAVRTPLLLRTRTWTLQRLFDWAGLSPAVQAVLATQCGDLGLPPAAVSAALYAALVWCYGSGAYYPERHFSHVVERLAGAIRDAPGCRLELGAEVVRIVVERGRAQCVVTSDGRRVDAEVVVSNADPRLSVELIGREHLPSEYLKRLEYDYSVGSFSLYLAVRGVDLREHGFGAFNVWHYPSLDVNEAYRRQLEDNDFSAPWLFLSSATLMTDGPARVCPEGEQLLTAVTVAPYDAWRALRDRARRDYLSAKRKVCDRFLDVLDAHYVPGIRDHLALRVAGSPTTNARFLRAPRGSIYGPRLTPRATNFDRLRYQTPIPNLFFTGAAAEYPSVGATVAGGERLYAFLTGDPVNPGRSVGSLM